MKWVNSSISVIFFSSILVLKQMKHTHEKLYGWFLRIAYEKGHQQVAATNLSGSNFI